MFTRKGTKRLLIVLLSLWIVLFLSGCSEELRMTRAMNLAKNARGDEERLRRNEAYLSNYPNGEYAETARRVLDDLTIKAARKENTLEGYMNLLENYPENRYINEAYSALAVFGYRFPESAEYNPNAPGPVRLILIREHTFSTLGLGPNYDFDQWNEKLPAEWRASSFYEAPLLVILKDSNFETGKKQYTGGKTLVGWTVITEITIQEARTGTILFTGSLRGSAPTFPSSFASDKIPTPRGLPASYSDFEKWLFKVLK